MKISITEPGRHDPQHLVVDEDGNEVAQFIYTGGGWDFRIRFAANLKAGYIAQRGVDNRSDVLARIERIFDETRLEEEARQYRELSMRSIESFLDKDAGNEEYPAPNVHSMFPETNRQFIDIMSQCFSQSDILRGKAYRLGRQDIFKKGMSAYKRPKDIA
jgi:hypothetical protein